MGRGRKGPPGLLVFEDPFRRDPNIQIILTLGSKVCKQYQFWGLNNVKRGSRYPEFEVFGAEKLFLPFHVF